MNQYKSIQIWDLDGTVICSKHRQLTDSTGALDLLHWREHCTPEKIALDQELPLIEIIRDLYASGHLIIVCTARVMSTADWQWLEEHGIKFHHALVRHGDHDTRRDFEMKREKILSLFASLGITAQEFHNVYLWDDNRGVLEMARSLGFNAIDSVVMNKLALLDFQEVANHA